MWVSNYSFLLSNANIELPIQGVSFPIRFISSGPGTFQAPRGCNPTAFSCPVSGHGLTKRKTLISTKELIGSRVAG